ncbi:hypothetical protein GJ744_010270 [Endocarpon pusillum]|uniref:Uncharacterized protein n=1 Tax=Endocarpon pusillum TaxID=364733 RepID=A0A8H7AEF4_9EURO|nr:hypothetical protein GJ744_010270 [Endocarpon pusillum]
MLSSFFFLTCLSSVVVGVLGLHSQLPVPLPVLYRSVENYTPPPTLTFDMPIDHFDDSDTRTYKNRYWINDTFYQEGGPVFFYDVGEGAVSDLRVIEFLGEDGTRNAPLRLAEQFKGMAVVWEHRFYGGSLPFPLDKDTGKALEGYDAYKYLNNEQALEDTVYFASNFKPPGYEDSTSLSPSNTPWIWVGASYSGVRGAIMRVRNPEIFYATWASSAPVQAQIDMSVYANPMQQSMPSNCSADAHAAVAYADNIFLHGTPEEVSTLKRAIYLACNIHTDPAILEIDQVDADSLDYYFLAANLSYPFYLNGFSFQYYNYAGSLGNFCDFLESWNPGNATDFDIDTTGTEWLRDSADGDLTTDGVAASYGNEQAFYAFLAFLSANAYQSQNTSRGSDDFSLLVDNVSWNWQYCSEFGYFMVANASDPTSLISRFLDVPGRAQHDCKDVFSYAPDLPDVDTILKYGGYSMSPSNTLFTDGERDPWRTLGVQATKEINPSASIRESTIDVPACNAPPEGGKVFGVIYADEVHGSDMARSVKKVGSEKVSPADTGFHLFSKALEKWLECWKQ